MSRDKTAAPEGDPDVAMLTFKGHRIASRVSFTPDQCAEILRLCHIPVAGHRSVLASENSVSRGDIPGIGRVVVKHYRRGGLFRRVLGRRYLRAGSSRPQREFELLAELRELGVRVPEPIAYVTRGRAVYRGWLITREISNVENLVQVCREDPQRTERACELLVGEIRKLISANVHHIDLHPGNVLVGGENEVWIVDFDKACRSELEPVELRDKYLLRWRRAVIKHRLPELLSELLCAKLRQRMLQPVKQ